MITFGLVRKRYRCLGCRGTLMQAHDDESWVNPIYVHVDTLSEYCPPRIACPDVDHPLDS